MRAFRQWLALWLAPWLEQMPDFQVWDLANGREVCRTCLRPKDYELNAAVERAMWDLPVNNIEVPAKLTPIRRKRALKAVRK